MADGPKAKDPGALSEDAWGLIAEAMHSGTMSLPGGRAIVLGAGDLVKLTQWLATIKARKPKAFAGVDDFVPKETKKS